MNTLTAATAQDGTAEEASRMNPLRQHPWINFTSTLLWLWYPWPNGCLQQIAANRFSTPLDVIAILLQGFVYARHGRDSMGCKSPVRDWEPERDQ
jgi:hypothetical protein